MATGTAERMDLSIKRGDLVQVVAGREKGKSGKVLKVDLKRGRLLVEKVNMVKRHMRPSQKHPQGGVLPREAPLPYSNVQLHCPKCDRGVRHGRRWEDKAPERTKIRFCKKCGETL